MGQCFGCEEVSDVMETPLLSFKSHSKASKLLHIMNICDIFQGFFFFLIFQIKSLKQFTSSHQQGCQVLAKHAVLFPSQKPNKSKTKPNFLNIWKREMNFSSLSHILCWKKCKHGVHESFNICNTPIYMIQCKHYPVSTYSKSPQNRNGSADHRYSICTYVFVYHPSTCTSTVEGYHGAPSLSINSSVYRILFHTNTSTVTCQNLQNYLDIQM